MLYDFFERRRAEKVKGVVLRCATGTAAPSAICVGARTEGSPCGDVTGNEEFDRRFRITAGTEKDARSLLTPQFVKMINALEQNVGGRLLSFRWEGRVLSLALETNYAFAAVAENVDLSDLDALRRSYTASLQKMAQTLDLLKIMMKDAGIQAIWEESADSFSSNNPLSSRRRRISGGSSSGRSFFGTSSLPAWTAVS